MKERYLKDTNLGKQSIKELENLENGVLDVLGKMMMWAKEGGIELNINKYSKYSKNYLEKRKTEEIER